MESIYEYPLLLQDSTPVVLRRYYNGKAVLKKCETFINKEAKKISAGTGTSLTSSVCVLAAGLSISGQLFISKFSSLVASAQIYAKPLPHSLGKHVNVSRSCSWRIARNKHGWEHAHCWQCVGCVCRYWNGLVTHDQPSFSSKPNKLRQAMLGHLWHTTEKASSGVELLKLSLDLVSCCTSWMLSYYIFLYP